MLIAKRYSGKPKVINLEKYHCIPTDHEQIGKGMKSYEEHLESVIEKEQKYTGNTEMNKSRTKRIISYAFKTVKKFRFRQDNV